MPDVDADEQDGADEGAKRVKTNNARRALERRQMSFESRTTDKNVKYFYNPDPQFSVASWVLPEKGHLIAAQCDLLVQINSAEDIKNNNMLKQPTPWVFGYVGSDGRRNAKHFRTSKVKGKSPVWNSTHTLVWSGEESLHLEIQGDSLFRNGGVIGQASIDLPLSLVDSGKKERILALHPQGHLHLKVELRSRTRPFPPSNSTLWRNLGGPVNVWAEAHCDQSKNEVVNRIREGQCFNVIGNPTVIKGKLWFRLAWGLPKYDETFTRGGEGVGWIFDPDAVGERSVTFLKFGFTDAAPSSLSACGSSSEDEDDDELASTRKEDFAKTCRVLKLFKSLDTDDSGTLDRSQFEALFQKLGVGDADAEALFAVADEDGNGAIDYDEFVAWIFFGKDSFAQHLGFLEVRRARAHMLRKGELIYKVLGSQSSLLLLRSDNSFSFVHKDIYRFCSGVQGTYIRKDVVDEADEQNTIYTLKPEFFGPRVKEYFSGKCPSMTPIEVKISNRVSTKKVESAADEPTFPFIEAVDPSLSGWLSR